MKATTTKEAWKIADEIFPTDYIKNERASIAAGYNIYESTLPECNAWISDLGNRLEINLPNGKSVNIWIEAETPTEAEKTPAEHAETTITLESITTHTATGNETTTTREARVTLSDETTLKNIAQFERDARRLIKSARAAKNRGDAVTVILTKAKYTFRTWEDLKQTRFEMWESYGDSISADGVHLTPSTQYNDDPARDMWLTGTAGEIFNEITI